MPVIRSAASPKNFHAQFIMKARHRFSKCLGVFFDNGEVDQLVDKNRPGFLSRMATIFKD